MALENVLYPQDSFCYTARDFWGCDYILPQLEQNNDFSLISNKNVATNLQYEINLQRSCVSSALLIDDFNNDQLRSRNNLSPDGANSSGRAEPPVTSTTDRKRRRRAKICKNKEDMESQRMTHIAVERNRRKQMNEYLAVIRSLMPTSFVQRNDQASIIGGAINYVKQLEHQLQTLEAQHKTTVADDSKSCCTAGSPRLFADFFAFPQYPTCSSDEPRASSDNDPAVAEPEGGPAVVAYGEIEVTVMESHANLKMLTKKRPKQLVKIVAGLQSMWLTILHVNVTTVEQMVLYTLSLKIEEGCQMNTVNEIADAVNQLLAKIEEAEV
ncbi:hypothetical protein DCAR_0418230 [Daucus carota subsp. sativus]|uniref:BHLH domain-containing protein n=1 Tax=Daucus carota subsp. sativus TaxID=79200 RepID=A0AAF0X0L4_DAUCS|nr:hypothetical protein DCAR_0418230 [Daucus carota subsp. sativus]